MRPLHARPSRRLRCLFGWLLLTAVPLAQAAPDAADSETQPGFTPKLSAPIDIGYSFRTVPAVGESLVISIAVTPGEDLLSASLSLGADDALTIIEPLASVELGSVAAAETVSIEVIVLPLAARTLYLRVAVAGLIRGQPQARSIAVPIRLAAAAAPKPEAQTAGKPEQSVRSFPAVETVR